MKKSIVLAILAAGLMGLGLGVTNLFLFKGTPFQNFPAGNSAADAVRQMLEKKCLSCHSPQGRAPYYAAFPLAKQLIQRDMKLGTKMFDLEQFMNPPAGSSVNEAGLAKLEHIINEGDMPPVQFLALHWDCFMTAKDKEAIRQFVKDARSRFFVTWTASEEFRFGALQPLPDEIEANPSKVALGKKLYHDKRLSGDDSLSCASCHDLAKGGTDQEKFSTGIRRQEGPINSPTVYNSVFNFVQFWDGRAKDLKEQAGGPVTNPKEMGAQWPEVVAKLNQDKALKKEFASAYPAGLTQENIQDAISEFEKSLITPNSRFDKYLKGDKAALSEMELRGMQVFLDHGCQTCHVGKNLGGQSFEKMGLYHDYFADRGNLTEADNGRYNVTKDEKDRYSFKVPTLRNIEKTSPYFHDGSTKDLKEAVKIMARYQTEDSVSDAQADQIVAFLKTLTGELDGQPLQ